MPFGVIADDQAQYQLSNTGYIMKTLDHDGRIGMFVFQNVVGVFDDFRKTAHNAGIIFTMPLNDMLDLLFCHNDFARAYAQ